MLTGPQNMPKFTDRQLSPEEKKDIIAFIKSVEGDNNNPGGNPLGGIGPVSEGVVAFTRRARRTDRIRTVAGGQVVTTRAGHYTATSRRAAELEDMSQPELARLAAELDDVEIVHNTPKWPVPGTRAERRAERAVALWFIISGAVGAGVPRSATCSGRSSTWRPASPATGSTPSTRR